MDFSITANFVEGRTGKVRKGFIRKATEFDLIGWATWRYKLEDEDREWDWLAIYTKSKRPKATTECYAAIAAGELHALMALKLRRNNRSVLIDYLATNPNYRHAADRLKYVGTALVAVAVSRSYELGYKGRIYLESLAGAKTFYQSLGMTHRPKKSRDGHTVYAFNAEGAQQFLEQIKEKKILML